MSDAERLTISDAESTYKAILDLVIGYPSYPSGFSANNTNVKWNSTGNGNSIGLFPLQGAIYLKKYISGSYVAQMPFEIVYKCSPTTNKAMTNAQDLLMDLAKWLEECVINFEPDTHITLEKIARTSVVFIASQDEKATEFAVNLQLNYSFSK